MSANNEKPIRSKSFETSILHAYYVEYPQDCICTVAIKKHNSPPKILIRELSKAIEWLAQFD